MKWHEKLTKAEELFAEAKAILEDENASAEDKGRVEELMTDAKALKTDALALKDILDSAITDIMKERKTQPPKEDRGTSPLPSTPAKKFKAWGDFLYAVWNKQANHVEHPGLRWFRDEKREDKAMAEATGAGGGFLVPAEFLAQLQSVMAEESIVRGRATIIRMRRRQVTIPVLDQTGTTAGRPHWFGGMKFYWTEEATEKTDTEPKFRQINLTAHKLIGYTFASDELLADSAISLGDFISGPLGFAGGLSWMEDYAFLNGTGAGQPLGVIGAPATITINRAATNAIGWADLANMMENFLPSGRGVWIISQSAMADLIQLTGPTGNPSYIWQPNAREGVPGFLLGMPVIWSEKVPRIGTAGDVVLADWRYYLLGDRQATTIESTKFDRWKFDQTSWRAVHRVDGQPWLSTPLTYQDGTTQVSPFVILGDKST
jgi:HK97 family phage major capsid protein